MNNLNPNSHLTAIERTSLSYPARILLNQKKIIGKVLDFGCGIGKDFELLKQKGFDIVGYDPFYFPEFQTEIVNKVFQAVKKISIKSFNLILRRSIILNSYSPLVGFS